MNEIVFTYRNKTWKLHKDPHCYVLSSLIGTEWSIKGYYSDPKAIIMSLVKEHFINSTEARNFVSSLEKTKDEIGLLIKKALG